MKVTLQIKPYLLLLPSLSDQVQNHDLYFHKLKFLFFWTHHSFIQRTIQIDSLAHISRNYALLPTRK